MTEVHHFTYGWLTPTLSYALSFLGSLLGLLCTARAQRTANGGRRAGLLVGAAFAIGGTGIWVMHFLAMIGFSVPDATLRFDIPLTVASFLMAVLMVGFGLFVVGLGRPSVWKVLIGGPLTGVGVAFMHYTGMAAMQLDGGISYDHNLVYASYGIAVVAATAALWFTVVVRGALATVGAAAVMGVAVSGMHYTGMAALRVHLDDQPHPLTGVSVNVFLAPIVLFVIAVAFALANVLMAVPEGGDRWGVHGPGPDADDGGTGRSGPSRTAGSVLTDPGSPWGTAGSR